MAMSTSIRKGEFAPQCNLCDTNNNITWKCVECDLLMCNNCRDVRHSRIRNAKNHKVVDLKEIGSNPAKLDFSSIQCTAHKSQVCVMFCESCDQLVCLQCIVKVHNGHKFVEIAEGYKLKIQRLKDIEYKLKIQRLKDVSQIKTKMKEENQIQEIKKAENAKYLEAKEQIGTQNLSLKRSVDQHTKELLKEVDQRWKSFSSSIEKEGSRINALKKHSTSGNTTQLDDIINSNDPEKIFEMNTEELEKTLQEASNSLELNFTSMPIFLPGEITQYNMGSLQNTTDIALREVQEYTTDFCEVYYMSSCVDSLLISNGDVVQKVQPEVNNLKVISNFNIEINGMAVTPSNDLLLAPNDESVLKQISFSTNKLTDTNYSVDPQSFSALHVTSDYKVIVGVTDFEEAFPVTGRRAVISIDKDGKHKTTYEYDRANQQIFTLPRKITTTHSNNICVVDRLSSDYKGRVVIFGLSGDIINIYNGYPNINTVHKTFKPRDIATTPLDNIVVSDLDTGTLHILNNGGHLITYFNTKDIGIQLPYSLAFNSTGKLYIGCATYQDSIDMAKLHEVKISEY